jgi:hypothetical protein
LRNAAEQMAHEELGHIATLRSERRRAFHQQRDGHPGPQQQWQLAELERRLVDLLAARSPAYPRSEAEQLLAAARLADDRAAGAATAPSGAAPPICDIPPEAQRDAALLCEILLDHYLGLAESPRSENVRAQAQRAAGDIVRCLSILRRPPA